MKDFRVIKSHQKFIELYDHQFEKLVFLREQFEDFLNNRQRDQALSNLIPEKLEGHIRRKFVTHVFLCSKLINQELYFDRFQHILRLKGYQIF